MNFSELFRKLDHIVSEYNDETQPPQKQDPNNKNNLGTANNEPEKNTANTAIPGEQPSLGPKTITPQQMQALQYPNQKPAPAPATTTDPKADVNAMAQALKAVMSQGNVQKTQLQPTVQPTTSASVQQQQTNQNTSVNNKDLQQKAKPGEPTLEEQAKPQELSREDYIKDAIAKVKKDPSKFRRVPKELQADVEKGLTADELKTAKQIQKEADDYIRDAIPKIKKDPGKLWQVPKELQAEIQQGLTPDEVKLAKLIQNTAIAQASGDKENYEKFDKQRRELADKLKLANTQSGNTGGGSSSSQSDSGGNRQSSSSSSSKEGDKKGEKKDDKGSGSRSQSGNWYRGTDGDYTIQPGDTLSSIAKRNNTTVDQLKKLNNIQDINKILAGAKLKTKAPAPAVDARAGSADARAGSAEVSSGNGAVSSGSADARAGSAEVSSGNGAVGSGNGETTVRLSTADAAPAAARGERTSAQVSADTGLSTVPGELRSTYGTTNVTTASDDEYAWRAMNPNWNMTNRQYPGPGKWDPTTGRDKNEIEQGRKNWDALKKVFGFGDKETVQARPEVPAGPKSMDQLRHDAASKDASISKAARDEIARRQDLETQKESKVISLQSVVDELLQEDSAVAEPSKMAKLGGKLMRMVPGGKYGVHAANTAWSADDIRRYTQGGDNVGAAIASAALAADTVGLHPALTFPAGVVSGGLDLINFIRDMAKDDDKDASAEKAVTKQEQIEVSGDRDLQELSDIINLSKYKVEQK